MSGFLWTNNLYFWNKEKDPNKMKIEKRIIRWKKEQLRVKMKLTICVPHISGLFYKRYLYGKDYRRTVICGGFGFDI